MQACIVLRERLMRTDNFPSVSGKGFFIHTVKGEFDEGIVRQVLVVGDDFVGKALRFAFVIDFDSPPVILPPDMADVMDDKRGSV